jgi:uncharacterized protein (TIGR03382 family)
MNSWLPVLVIVIGGATSIVHASPASRCALGSSSDLGFSTDDIPELSADTGFIPAGSPVQVRVTGRLVGNTSVAMGLQPTACWDEHGMTVGIAGVPQAGLLDSQYGAELHVFVRIHASVLGHTIDFTGEVPLGGFIPSDLLLADVASFDPTLLPGSPTTSVAASDTTSPITVLSTNVLGTIIPVGGLTGDLNITAQGELTTSYSTNRVAVGNAALSQATDVAAVVPPAEGYRGVLVETLGADGSVEYAPSIVLSLHANVKIFGIGVASFTIATVNLPLPNLHRDINLAGSATGFALPFLDTVPERLGFSSGGTQSLPLHDAGGAPLVVDVVSAPAGVTAAELAVEPGQTGRLVVTASDPTSLAGTSLVLSTNDPDHLQLMVALDPSAGNPDDGGGDGNGGGGGGGGDDDGNGGVGSGCNAGSSSSSGAVALALALVLWRRRRTS